MLKKIAAILLFFSLAAPLSAQLGGESAYNFLKLNPSAKSAAMGSVGIAPMYSDVSMTAQNPALLDSSMHRKFSLTYLNYFAGISHSSLSGAWNRNEIGTFGVNLVSLNYGSFDGASDEAVDEGTFSVNQFALGLLYSREVWHGVSLGAELNTIVSQMERYTSVGMAVSVGVRYRTPDKLLNTTLAFKNVGFQLKQYTDNSREKVPFEIQFSLAKKFAKAPFGISFSLNDLQSFNTYYKTSENEQLMDGTVADESVVSKIGNEFLSHVAIGLQIIPSQYFFVMAGYNFRRHNDLKVGDSSGMTGFSFGFGLRLKYFELNYARATYHAGQGSNHFGITIKL